MLLNTDKNINCTETFKCRRYINKLKSEGFVGNLYLNGSGGKILFYSLNKDYNIIIALKHKRFRYFYFNKFKKELLVFIMEDTKELINNKWEHIGNEVLFKGDVIKWI
jgi:hypothetical protein